MGGKILHTRRQSLNYNIEDTRLTTYYNETYPLPYITHAARSDRTLLEFGHFVAEPQASEVASSQFNQGVVMRSVNQMARKGSGVAHNYPHL